ncbi:leucine-rich repeat-containing protein 63 [Cricetulus griseus]|nr:leucine-rich repeat-containing protein 63 [Cricetulus griseus]
MNRSNCHSLKTQQNVLLLRRPLPPKLKLPLSKKNVQIAAASESEKSHVQFSEDESESVKINEGVCQLQRPVSIHSISLDHDYKAYEKVVNILPHARHAHMHSIVHWKIPHSVFGSMFIPSCLSASSRVFRKNLRQMRRARKLQKKKKKKDKRDSFFTTKPFYNILILSNQFVKAFPTSYSRFLTSRFTIPTAESHPVSKTPDFIQELPLLGDVSEPPFSPIPSTLSVTPEPQWSERPRHPHMALNKVILNINSLPAIHTLPRPVSPRRPQRQIAIESAAESGKMVPFPKPREAYGTMRKVAPGAYVFRGEGFKTIAATRYETLVSMSALAIINCQIYGRNALNLKGFFLLQCPDLKPIAFQLVYLNLSFNDLNKFPMEILCLQNLQILKLRNNPIRQIPNEIHRLRYLRIFTIAFNLIRDLPIGIFMLLHLADALKALPH